MPTDLGREFPPVIIVKPPHMSEEDLELYKRWAPEGLKGALHQWFDVGLGDIPTIPADTAPEMRRMWVRVNQKRADAVVEYFDRVEIIEFRHLATLNVVGRLLGYKMLWEDDPRSTKPLVLRVVSNRKDSALERMAKEFDINFSLV